MSQSFIKPLVQAILLLLLANILMSDVNVVSGAVSARKLQPLKVSRNSRFLIRSDGTPFFWLGDTAWALFSKSSREEQANQPSVVTYFRNRQQKGFTVIQAVLVGEDGTSNTYNQTAFIDHDYQRPNIVEGENNDFWDMADYLIDQAAAHNLYIALLPVWINSLPPEHAMIKNPKIGYDYGYFVGNRYRDRSNIIWIMGGDPYLDNRDVDNPKVLATVRAMAEGVADGVSNQRKAYDKKANYSAVLMSYHPAGGGRSSSKYLHREPWLDFNMIQTTSRRSFINWFNISEDYTKIPAKPTLESEVTYEYSFSLDKEYEQPEPRITDWDVRRAAYWSIFAGGFGFSYGHRCFIRWVRKGETYPRGADKPWYESLDAPGAFNMTHLRSLMESRPFLNRIPDQSLVYAGIRGGNDYVTATRASDGSYGMLYFPTGGSVIVDLSWLRGNSFKAWWFNPREGTFQKAGDFPFITRMRFFPPTKGETQDWVLVIDNASKNFPPPGRRVLN
jgi:hypothetical protein